jgi:hypothetical protein
VMLNVRPHTSEGFLPSRTLQGQKIIQL